MNNDNKPILLAGTRVTGDMPHIGTFYGWISQITRAKEFFNVVILIADYQSFDVQLTQPIGVAAQKLKSVFNHFLPGTPVILESEIPDIITLGFLIANYVKPRYYKRIMPIKKYLDENDEKISIPRLIYPSMMVADLIALNASCVFNKPEGKFQHSEILNDIIADLNKKNGCDLARIHTFKKESFNIFSLDGTGPMKRNREKNGIIEIYDTTEHEILQLLKTAPIQKGKCDKCLVIKSIWDATLAHEQCTCFSSCDECLCSLAHKIHSDLTHKTDNNPSFANHNEIIKSATKRVKNFIDLLNKH